MQDPGRANGPLSPSPGAAPQDFLLYLFATPMYWMVMPWMRRLRLISLGDFFEERYGSKRMAGLYAVIGVIGMMTIISVGFAAMTKTVVALTRKRRSN